MDNTWKALIKAVLDTGTVEKELKKLQKKLQKQTLHVPAGIDQEILLDSIKKAIPKLTSSIYIPLKIVADYSEGKRQATDLTNSLQTQLNSLVQEAATFADTLASIGKTRLDVELNANLKNTGRAECCPSQRICLL